MVTLFFRQFARYPFLYVLGAFPAWLKVLSCNFGAILLKKPKNVRDSAPLIRKAVCLSESHRGIKICDVISAQRYCQLKHRQTK